MDIRVAISRARVAARAVIRLATFAQAISSTNATKTPSAASERRFSFCKSETRSEEHTSELQSRLHLVCRLLLEKKKKTTYREQSLYLYPPTMRLSATPSHTQFSTHDRVRDLTAGSSIAQY